MWRATEEFGLEFNDTDDCDDTVGVRDGEKFLITVRFISPHREGYLAVRISTMETETIAARNDVELLVQLIEEREREREQRRSASRSCPGSR